MTLLDTVDDPQLFGRLFRPTASWAAWRVALKALFALAPTTDDLTCYTAHTGRSAWPSTPAREAWLVVGRRGGKSRIAALVAVYLACFRDYTRVLAPGERGHVMVLAADRRQARVVFRYIVGLLDAVPMLAALIERRTAEPCTCRTRSPSKCTPHRSRRCEATRSSPRSWMRSSFWPTEDSANPDVEIVNAIKPAMSTVAGALLLGISSPYARRGALWDAFRQHHGQDGDPVLVWQAATQAMNPTIDARVIADAYAADDHAAAAEYGAEFRRDIETFVSREIIDACVVSGQHELPPRRDVQHRAFCDPSGGSSDSFTLAIAHAEVRHGRRIAVLDALRERRPPFSPEQTVAEFAALLRTYGLTEVTGIVMGASSRARCFALTASATRSQSGRSRTAIAMRCPRSMRAASPCLTTRA